MSSNILTVWELLLCLIWKNWCVQWKNWHTVLFCILTPTFFMTIPIVIRCMISCENFPTIIYEPVDLKESWSNLLSVLSNRNYKYFNVSRTNSFNVYVPQMIIAYAPNTYILFNKIMNHAIMSLGGMDLIGYSSCELLYNAMQTKYYFAGVCFDENIFQSNTDEIPSQLNYTLLYPSELRFYHDTYITSNWNTNILFNFVTPPDSRVGRDKTGGYVGYVREGFSSLQHQIFLSYMNLDSVVEELKETFNGVTRIPDILLHRFPYRAHTVDKFLNGIKSSLSLIIIISYTVPVTIFIKYIVEEKEKNLQIVLKNMGAPYALQLISWVVVAFFQLLLSSIILVTLIKIPWSDGNGILPNSSWLALLLVMSLYSLVAATFSVLLSIFFVKAKYAVIITVALWILTFFPYASLLNKLNHEILTRILIFLLPNTTMGLIIGNIQNLEVNDIGIQFKNYFSSQTLEIHFSIGILSITMLLQSIVHMVMAIYIDMLIPDKTGRVKKLNLFLTDVFKRRRPGSSIQDTTRPGSSNRSITVIEVETLKPPILEITNLCKKYDNKYVVQNVNMTLYENDTTILMGHNGSGKKTLLKMIVGLLHPTSGDMKINGIEWTADKGYDDISFAINDQILFGNLTVQDQLTFFCRMKGIEYPKCKMQVIKYLKSTLLKNYSNCYTDNLTLGLKNILALCCALIGDSKIIILCDPFEGLDILTRKYMFNLLLKERIGRTLLLSTNSYDVAETFGNRMAIMANGEIKCSGTPSFLKRVYCYGYCLRILMGKLSKSDDIKKLLRKYIINIEPDYMLGNEISFLLEQKYSYVFDDIFDEFEERWNELNIVHLEVNEHSLRDVFLQYGADGSSYGNSLRHHEILNGISKYLDRSNPVTLFQTYKTLKGRKLILNHWNAYVYKRFIHLIRSPLIFGSIVILPILCTVMPFSLLQIKLNNDDLKPMSYRLQQYQRSATTIEILRKTDPMSESSELEYQQLVFWSSNPHQVEVIETPFEEYLIKQEKLKASKINELYLVAASFKKNYTAWFNNYPLHTVPLSLNLMHNAIARAILGIDSSIELNFQPLPFTNKYHAMMMHVPLSHNMLLPLCTSLCLSFVWSISIIFTIREKITNLKFLQFIAGAKKDSFFLTGLILDILVVLVTGIITVATMMVIDQDRFNDTDVRESYFLTIIAGGICVTSMNHVLGRFFRDPYLAFCVVITIHFFGITNFAIYTEVFYKNHDDGLSYINTLGRILYIMPLFTQCSAMSTIFFINDLIVMCSDQTIYTISTYVENCDSMPNCCVEYSVWDGVSSSIFILMGLTIFYWILMYLMEYMQTCDLFNYKQRSMEQITRENNLMQYRFAHEVHNKLKVNYEVIQEQFFVSKMTVDNLSVTPLSCGYITKIRNHRALLNRICLSVKNHECVSVMGVNNSGKSTLLRVLAGATNADYGYVLVGGHSLNNKQNEANKYIGYSPKNLILLSEYKVYEFLYIICLLRGMPKHEIKNTYENLAKALSIYDDLNKYIADISVGVSRRVCLITAMLGNTCVILLEEPTMYADVASRRIIWNVICQLKESGRACIITTHNIRDSLFVCDRLAILGANGAFYAFTSLQGIRDKFVDAYTIEVTMKNVAQDQKNAFDNKSNTLIQFVTNNFPGAFLKSVMGNNITFVIPDNKKVKMSTIFREIQTNVSNLSIEDCIIRKTPMKPLIINLMERSTRDHKKYD